MSKCLKDSQAKKALHLNALFFKKMETINHSNGAYSEKVLGRRIKNSMKKMKTIMAVLILSLVGLHSINTQSNMKIAFKVSPLTMIKGQ